MLFLAEGGTYRLDRHAFVFILLLWVLGANCNEAQSSGYRVERDISLLWYNFTTCGYSGQEGPPYKICREHYSSSPISLHLLPPILPYDGIQLFQLPRIGRYRIIASGGGGGGGVCNTQPGSSPILEVNSSVNYDRHILEITIGHRGAHACKYKNSSKFCNFNASEQCSVEWKNLDFLMKQADGGGGGGGGTLVGLRHNGDYRHIFPATILLLVGGGGGASSSLNSNTDTMKNGIYHADMQDPGSGQVESPPDYLYNAGPGGGAALDRSSTSVYGKSFKDTNLYAEGGEDCSLGLNVMFGKTHGGFGGGGGGCASGGGGGGYRGGNTRNHATVHYPGHGGSSKYLYNSVDLLGWNYGNGFFRIRHENCGCAHDCEIDSNRSVFWCTCPSNTVLSPDGYDCHREEDVTFNISSNSIKAVNLSGFGLVELYSINAIPANKRDNYLKQLLSVRMNMSVETTAHPTSNQATESCGVLVLNRNLGIVASLNTFAVEGPLKANHKDQFSISSSRKVNTDYRDDGSYDYSLDPPTELLNGSVELYSMVLYQTLGVKCTITRMSVNTSVEELYVDSSTLPTGSVPSDSNLTHYFGVLALSTTATPPRTPSSTLATSTPTEPTITWYITVAISVLGGTLGIAICILFLFVGCTIYSRRRRCKRTLQAFRAMQSSPEDNHSLSHGDYADQIQRQSSRRKRSHPTRKASFKRNSRSMSASVNVRDDLCVSLMNTYAELNVPNYGVDLEDMPENMDFAEVNYARMTANDSEWHISRESLSYMKELGEGEFGKVLLMQAKCICGYEGLLPVAVKTLSHEKMKDIHTFMEEVNLMKRFTHPRIVSLLGYCPAEENGAPMMVLELMKYGDLQSFLQSNKPEPDSVPIISHPEFFHFALDIAKALEFLAGQSYVHRDVAARNCLVGDKLIVKLADFGLARDIHGKDYYRLGGKAKLPVKWMAPESLLYGQFTQATDVWSFGVLIWEITSYGEIPLPQYTVQEVVDLASSGNLCHNRPDHCPEELYFIMQNCLQIDYNSRPNFCELKLTLQDYHEDDLRLIENQSGDWCAYDHLDNKEYSRRSPSPNINCGLD